MPAEPGYVIVGASLAGAKAAQTLRSEGFTGPVTLIGAEDELPYERPPLSKGYLLGSDDRDSMLVHEASWYSGHDISLQLGTAVTAIDRPGRRVQLAGGQWLAYQRLLITTGVSPRQLQIPGCDRDGVMYLRTAADSDRLRDALRGGGPVVIAGGGWIGLETAAAARHYGCDVTVVEPEPGVLRRSIGPELGEVYARLHTSHGVTFRFGERLSEVTGPAGTAGGVVTSAGTQLPAEVVVIGVGAVPNSQLAQAAGLEAGNGIWVDASLRTADPDIFAAGDVAAFDSPLLGRRIRVEHWGNALAGGPAAARAMMGQAVSYDWVPYFYSDQYDLGMEAAGLPEPGRYDEIVYRGDPESGAFIAFWLSRGAVVAGMNVNIWDVSDDIQALIRSGRPVDRARLADPDVPVADLQAGSG